MSNNKLNEFSEDFALDELESADSIDELPHNRKDEKELDERNKIYTKILYNYSKYLEETLNKNKVSKKYLINLMISVLVLIIVAFIIISFKGNHVAIISAFISLVSAIIVIPTKIVEYLFNPQETQQISEIIKNIQNYDKAIRDDLSKEQK
ncbi:MULTISPECIES: hypothetical protein [Catenibacterium]|jgi:hypothetical protein|uniref:hypothetical protein n=1 Tax=Catenibacterium TaxID=135858 RepID=UPI0006C6F335|nr:hypothetical protein [Catenibacterium mitsuokai]MCI6076281.1 hypothetical protein [Catenibacterium mitsuokai]CUP37827.1 Uncharacterised protein [Catenibacterium mitsuokai]